MICFAAAFLANITDDEAFDGNDPDQLEAANGLPEDTTPLSTEQDSEDEDEVFMDVPEQQQPQVLEEN